MKPIGLIGGMSWESTAVYYQQINRLVAQRLGGLHSAQIRLHSCDFAEIVDLQKQGAWEALAHKLAQAASAVERSGAGCVAICTNTMHRVADAVQAEVAIPVIDIRDVTGKAIRAQGIETVGLLGTRYTMEQVFWRTHLLTNWGVEVTIPREERQRTAVHSIIFDELCQGVQREESRARLVAMTEEMAANGAQGIILGCTELMLLLGQEHCRLPLFDTTVLHAQALVDYALASDASREATDSAQGFNAGTEATPYAHLVPN